MTTNENYKSMKKWNIYLHSICFLLVFTAFNTSGGIAQRALTGYQDETEGTDHEFKGIDGFISTSIVYTFFALSNWIAPIIVEFTSTKFSMMIGASIYVFYVATFVTIVHARVCICSHAGCDAWDSTCLACVFTSSGFMKRHRRGQ